MSQVNLPELQVRIGMSQPSGAPLLYVFKNDLVKCRTFVLAEGADKNGYPELQRGRAQLSAESYSRETGATARYPTTQSEL